MFNKSFTVSNYHSSDSETSLPEKVVPEQICSRQNFCQLGKPIVIPQMTNGIGLPFSRAYSPDLQSHDISMEEFMEFIDNLNVVYGSGASVQALNFASNAVDFLHVRPCRRLGGAKNALARAMAINSSELNRYLDKSNQEIFNPRRLSVKIATTEELLYLLDIPPQEMITLASLGEYSSQINMTDAYMCSLGYYISSVTFDVPPPSNQATSLSRLSQTQIMLKQQQTEQLLRSDMRQDYVSSRRQRRAINRFERDMDRIDRRSERELNRAYRNGNRNGNRSFQVLETVGEQEWEMRRLENDMMRLEMERRTARPALRRDGRDDAQDLRWLVIVGL